MSSSRGFFSEVSSFQRAACEVWVILTDILEQSEINVMDNWHLIWIPSPMGQEYWQSTLWCSTVTSSPILIFRLLSLNPRFLLMLQLPLHSDHSVHLVGFPARLHYPLMYRYHISCIWYFYFAFYNKFWRPSPVQRIMLSVSHLVFPGLIKTGGVKFKSGCLENRLEFWALYWCNCTYRCKTRYLSNPCTHKALVEGKDLKRAQLQNQSPMHSSFLQPSMSTFVSSSSHSPSPKILSDNFLLVLLGTGLVPQNHWQLDHVSQMHFSAMQDHNMKFSHS